MPFSVNKITISHFTFSIICKRSDLIQIEQKSAKFHSTSKNIFDQFPVNVQCKFSNAETVVLYWYTCDVQYLSKCSIHVSFSNERYAVVHNKPIVFCRNIYHYFCQVFVHWEIREYTYSRVCSKKKSVLMTRLFHQLHQMSI